MAFSLPTPATKAAAGAEKRKRKWVVMKRKAFGGHFVLLPLPLLFWLNFLSLSLSLFLSFLCCVFGYLVYALVSGSQSFALMSFISATVWQKLTAILFAARDRGRGWGLDEVGGRSRVRKARQSNRKYVLLSAYLWIFMNATKVCQVAPLKLASPCHPAPLLVLLIRFVSFRYFSHSSFAAVWRV